VKLCKHYFLNYYTSFANKIIVFDNESTDNTLSILEDYKNKQRHILEKTLPKIAGEKVIRI